MTDTNKERAEFEAWAVNEGFQIRRLHNPEAGRDYGIDSAQDAWEGWQARAAKAPAAEPVACVYQAALDIRTAQGWQLGGEKCPVLYTDTINGQQVRRDDLWLCSTAAFTAPPAPTEQWVSVAERLPEPGNLVLLDIGKRTPIRAMWAAKHTVEVAADDESDFGEYDEERDVSYYPEGWYEWNQNEEVHWAVAETALHWQPMPAPPQGAAKGAT